MKQPTMAALCALVAADPPRNCTDRAALAAALGLDDGSRAGTDEDPRVMPFDEVARVLACTRRNVHQLCRAGQLRKVTLPGRKLSRGVLSIDVRRLLLTCVGGGAKSDDVVTAWAKAS
jgi:hypothetical protein